MAVVPDVLHYILNHNSYWFLSVNHQKETSEVPYSTSTLLEVLAPKIVNGILSVLIIGLKWIWGFFIHIKPVAVEIMVKIAWNRTRRGNAKLALYSSTHPWPPQWLTPIPFPNLQPASSTPIALFALCNDTTLFVHDCKHTDFRHLSTIHILHELQESHSCELFRFTVYIYSQSEQQ